MKTLRFQGFSVISEGLKGPQKIHYWGRKTGSVGACVAVFRLLLVILDALFIILCMIECSGDLETS